MTNEEESSSILLSSLLFTSKENVTKVASVLLKETQNAQTWNERIQSIETLIDLRQRNKLETLFIGNKDLLQQDHRVPLVDIDNNDSILRHSIVWKQVATDLLTIAHVNTITKITELTSNNKHSNDDVENVVDTVHSDIPITNKRILLEANNIRLPSYNSPSAVSIENACDFRVYSILIVSLCGCTFTFLAVVDLLKQISSSSASKNTNIQENTTSIQNSNVETTIETKSNIMLSIPFSLKVSFYCLEMIVFGKTSNINDNTNEKYDEDDNNLVDVLTNTSCSNDSKDDDWMHECDILLRMPQLVSNAYHIASTGAATSTVSLSSIHELTIPLWATPKKYYQRVIHTLLTKTTSKLEKLHENYSLQNKQQQQISSLPLQLHKQILDPLIAIVKHDVQYRGGEGVVLGFYRYYCFRRRIIRNKSSSSIKHDAMTKPEMDSTFHNSLFPTIVSQLLPREIAILIRSFLRHIVSMECSMDQCYSKVLLTTKLERRCWMDDTWCLLIEESISSSQKFAVCDAIIRLIVLSSSSVFVAQPLCHTNTNSAISTPDVGICQLLTQLLLRIGQRQCKYCSRNGFSRTVREPSVLPNSEERSDSDSDDDSEREEVDVLYSSHQKNSQTCTMPVALSTTQAAQETSLLRRYLTEVASIWSQPTFTRQTEYNLQYHVTSFLYYGLLLLSKHDTYKTMETETFCTSDLVSFLLNGVTCRLSLGTVRLRMHGMIVAEILSEVLAYDKLQFDELKSGSFRFPYVDFFGCDNNNHDTPTNETGETSNAKVGRDIILQGSMSDTKNDVQDERESETSSVHDDDSTWDVDHGLPAPLYDLDDDEEDLCQTQRPMYLIECLDLLRTPESEEHAYSRHMTALQELPHLIEAHPSDLMDVSCEVAVQLLCMENKFSIDDFTELITHGLVVLAVANPISVGNALIEQFFNDRSLCDRLNVLHTLVRSAYEISGLSPPKPPIQNNSNNHLKEGDKINEEVEQQRHQKVIGKHKLMMIMTRTSQIDKNDSCTNIANNEQLLSSDRSLTQRWGNAKLQRNGGLKQGNVIYNSFVQIGPIWFYALIGRFVESKHKSNIWGGQIGATLLSKFLITLSCIVECCGRYDNTSQILAKDLIQLSWSFCSADVADVRISVLVCISTALDTIRVDDAETIITILFGSSSNNNNIARAIQQMATADPDPNCRELSIFISKRILTCLEGVQNPTSLLSVRSSQRLQLVHK